jgi:hypothetical protein
MREDRADVPRDREVKWWAEEKCPERSRRADVRADGGWGGC